MGVMISIIGYPQGAFLQIFHVGTPLVGDLSASIL